MPEQSPYQEQWGFKEKHVVDYETISDTLDAYRFSAGQIAAFLPKDLTGKVVVDIGTGTANSLLTILENSPLSPALMVGLDPSGSWLKLARYKIGKPTTNQEDELWQSLFPQETSHRIKQQTKKSAAFNVAQELIQTSGFSLPFADHSVDCLTACQSIHWLLLRGHKTTEEIFRELKRVLKSSSILVFDESAFHLDFGDRTDNKGVNLNDLHLLSPHSFGGAFLKAFNEVLRANNHSQQLESFELAADGYKNFTSEGLIEALKKAGFSDVDFQARILSYTTAQTQASFRFAQETYFKRLGLENLTKEEKDALMEETFQKMGSHQYSPHEVFGYFVCHA